MKFWEGSACICIKEGKVLMVLQGLPEEEKRWSVPSGGIEKGETPEMCIVREVWEETGYRVQIKEKLFVKEGVTFGVPVKVHYFSAEILSGSPVIQDPDGLIHEIRWVSLKELEHLTLSFPEDYEVLLEQITKHSAKDAREIG